MKALQAAAKKYMADLVFIAVFAVAIPSLVVNKPDMHYNNMLNVSRTINQSGSRPDKVKDKRAPETHMPEGDGTGDYSHIAGRNIFAPGGSYDPVKYKSLAVLPSNPYQLIGVLTSGGKRAVFSLYTGEMVSLREGDKLLDGSVIKAIGPTAVTLKQGKTEREMKIFMLEKEKQKTQ